MKRFYFMILLTVSLLLSTAVAEASGTISSTQNPTVRDGFQQLGNIQVVVDAGSLKKGDSVVVRLPEFVSFNFENGVHRNFGGLQNRLVVPLKFNGNDNWNGRKAPFEVRQLDQRRIVITSLMDQKLEQGLVFYLQFGSIQINKGAYGAVHAVFEPSPSSGFPSGTASIGKVFGERTTFELRTSDFKQNGDELEFKLHIEEDQAEALTRNKRLRVRLPHGFNWEGSQDEVTLERTAGDLKISRSYDQEIFIERLNMGTQNAGQWEIPLQFRADETRAKVGEITLELQWDQLHRLTIGSYAKTEKKEYITFKVDSITYLRNKVEKPIDVAPYIKDGRTFLPVRFVAEAVGVKDRHIVWNQVARTVTLSSDKSIQLRVGSNILMIDGEEVVMDVAAEMKDGRVMLPIRYISEAFDKPIDWDEEERTVTIER